MSESFRLVILATAVLVLVALVTDWRRIVSHWTTSTTVLLAVAWLLNTRHLAAAITGDYYLIPERTATTNFGVVYGGSIDLIDRAALVALIVGGVVMVLRLVRAEWGPNPAGLVAALTAALVLLSTFFNGLRPDLVQMAAVVVVLALTVVCKPGPGAVLGAALYGATLVLASAALLAFRTDAATRPCGAKCGLLGELYTGAFVNENAFGLSLAVALPFALLAFDGWRRAAMVLALAAAVAGSESRTAQVAMVLTLVTFVIARAGRLPALPLVAALTSTVAALVVPFVVGAQSSTAFTGRGLVWWVAIEDWKAHWLVGLGGPAWRDVRTSAFAVGKEAVYSPHNQWLDILYAGGLVAGLGLVLLLVTMYRTSQPGDRLAVCLVIVAVMIAGIGERPWSFAVPDWLFWSLLAGCLTGRRPIEQSPPSRTPTRDQSLSR